MKRTAVLAGLVLILGAGAAHANFIGGIGKQVSFSLGASAAYNSVERGGVKAKQEEILATLGFGFKGWKIDLGGGLYNPDYQVEGFSQQINGDIQPFLRASFGGPIFVGKVLTIGPFIQTSFYPEHDETLAGNKITFGNTFDTVGGLRFQVDLEGAQLYGGPTIFWSEYDTKVAGQNFGSSTRDFGAMAGVNWPLYTGLHLGLEGHVRDGAGFSYALALNFPY
jgi:hypothetical protein